MQAWQRPDVESVSIQSRVAPARLLHHHGESALPVGPSAEGRCAALSISLLVGTRRAQDVSFQPD